MIDLPWFVAGIVLGSAAAYAVGAVRRHRGRVVATEGNQPKAAPGTAPTTDAHPTAAARHHASEASGRRIARSLAEDLATLVSGVEGRAHHLIAVAPDRTLLPQAAEGLLLAVQRLRTLHNKLIAFGGGTPTVGGATDVPVLVASIAEELQAMQFGLELRWTPPLLMPPVAAAPEAMRDALLFLCAALLRAERGATRLTIAAELGLTGDEPRLQLELTLEWVVEPHPVAGAATQDPTFTLDFEAANNLIVGQGGELTLHHLPGRCVRALVLVPALLPTMAPAVAKPVEPPELDVTEPEPVSVPDAEPVSTEATTADPEPADATPPRHRFGGALLLETDPSVRAMLAHELKAVGRAVFACADGAAAKSFLEATPERFEILIVDHHNRLEGDRGLTETIRSHAPALKICVLGGERPAHPADDGRRHWIQKPFGVHELRRALASVLADE